MAMMGGGQWQQLIAVVIVVAGVDGIVWTAVILD